MAAPPPFLEIKVICPECEEIFDEDEFIFCPYDGEKLEDEKDYENRMRILKQEEDDEENRLRKGIL